MHEEDTVLMRQQLPKIAQLLPPTRRRPPDPEWLLARFLEHHEKGHTLGEMLRRQPLTRDILLRLAAYLTDLVPTPRTRSQEQNLFDHCLTVACNEWIFGNSLTVEPDKQYAYFLRGLVAPITHVLMVTVESCLGEDCATWDPTHTTLTDWWAKQQSPPRLSTAMSLEYWRHILPIEFRVIVLVRFLLTEPKTLRLATRYLDFIIGR